MVKTGKKEKYLIPDVLNKILSSKEFSDAQQQQNLLKYLVETSLQGDSPKELTIAYEVLGRDKNFDPHDTRRQCVIAGGYQIWCIRLHT